jgi:phosphoribosylaminoimidazolecarboxamide formyltransferase/IMP cyclohydrolase
MADLVAVRRALLSVSDKQGIVELARALAAHGCEIISTGGTARALEQAGLRVTSIEQVTGFPEMMDGRVKTLHPKVHGGLLALRENPEHVQAMRHHDILAIDLLCVNLYPFEEATARPGCTFEEAIENIDIGGPAMIRSASKNFESVAVLTDPAQYSRVLAELEAHRGATTRPLRAALAAEAFARTCRYDAAIAEYLARPLGCQDNTELPAVRNERFVKAQDLRYGENPHQTAALYRRGGALTLNGTIVFARQLHGKELSYNNILDASAALELAWALRRVDASRPGAVVVKHTNPCGCALAESPLEAVDEAIACDPVAAYGGILALNTTLDEHAAARLAEKGVFMEVVVAPSFTPAAAEILKARSAGVRLLECGTPAPSVAEHETRSVPGGLLVQGRDLAITTDTGFAHAAGPAPTPANIRTARFLEACGRSLFSNAVALGGVSPTRPHAIRLFGCGAGQMDRVTACRLAVEKAGGLARGAVAFSDAFFPFSDGPKILIDAGVACIVHPGGSKRDQETFDLCGQRGVTCLTTGTRHFRH